MRGLSWIYNYVDLDPARKATAHKELDIFVYIQGVPKKRGISGKWSLRGTGLS